MPVSDLEFFVLEYLAKRDEGYGWKIQQWLESERDTPVRASSVYRVLRRLESRGWLKHRVGNADERLAGCCRKYFRANEAGRATYRKQRQRRQQYVERLMKSLQEGLEDDQDVSA